ncbi:MAG: folate family ECF transporter S component [Clostridiales bacterium]|jgi:ECF transporter S component (folate family)|nr:folate family ECF transporter S component [Clostridiales bacterium]
MNVKKITILSFLIALNVVLTRVLSFETTTIRISFAFLPIAIGGVMFGPVWGGAAAALADVIGMALLPKAQFFPGFTISAFLTGAVYGLLARGNKATAARVFIASAIVCVVINFGLDTLWLSMLYDRGVLAMLPGRVVKNAVMLAVQPALILITLKALKIRIGAAER